MRDKVFADKMKVVLTRVEADHRDLRYPLVYEVLLFLWQTFHVGRQVFSHVFYYSLSAPLQRLVELLD